MTKPMTDAAIGLIAGRGQLPLAVVESCLNLDRPIYVVWINQDTPPPALLERVPHECINIAAVGKAISFFKKNNVNHLVFAGGINRPSWSSLRPDAGGIRLLAKLKSLSNQGDNNLLSLIIRFFEQEHFHVFGVDEILPHLLAHPGTETNKRPDQDHKKDIEKGKEILGALSELDIGQSIIIQQGVVLGIEAIEGTDELIKRCAAFKLKGKGGVLVKCKKNNQDRRIDLPTIGPATIQHAYEAGLAGIAVQANQTLIIDKPTLVHSLNEYGMFLAGV